MFAERIDLLVQYALLKAGEEDSFTDRGLGPIHLLKYVYLADLAYAKAHGGDTFTGAPWVFFRFGPWSVEVYQRIEPALQAIQADKFQFPSDFEDRADWVRWSKADDFLLTQKRSAVPLEIRTHLDKWIHRLQKDTPALLDHVYRTAPMLAAAPGEMLDFTMEPPFVRPEPISEAQPRRTPRQLKKLKEAAKAMRQEHQERSAQQKRFVPKTGPYDDVYNAGVAWLDGLSGDPFQPQRLTVKFAPEVWKSPARKADDVP